MSQSGDKICGKGVGIRTQIRYEPDLINRIGYRIRIDPTEFRYQPQIETLFLNHIKHMFDIFVLSFVLGSFLYADIDKLNQ